MKDYSPERGTCSIETADINYLHYPGTGPDLVLLHATGFMPILWHPIARELMQNFNIYAPYFCDHRERDPEEGCLSWQILAQDFAHFCRAMNMQKPFLCGHSMGATVVTLAAGTGQVDPAKMLLIEPIFLPEPLYKLEIGVDQHPLASKSIKRKNYWSGRDEAAAYLRQKNLFKNWDNEMLELYLNHGIKPGEKGGLTLCCSPRREASLFMGSMARNPWPLLPAIECPVLVAEGEVSENRQAIDLKKAAKTFRKGRYAEIPGAGHLIPMEKPDAVKDLLKDFFLNT